MAVAAALWHYMRRLKREGHGEEAHSPTRVEVAPPTMCGNGAPTVNVATEFGTIQVVDRSIQDKLDANNDGVVSPEEMKQALSMVSIRADLLLVRMATEKELAVMIRKLPLFCICVISFVIGLLELTPPADTSDVHRHLHSHFHLDRLNEIVDFDSIYDYFGTFAEANSKLAATSSKYWCEDRYSDYSWDHVLSVPRWTCASPRQFALGLTQDTTWSWTAQHDVESQYYRRGLDGLTGQGSGDAGPAPAHRRTGAAGPSAADASYPCEDDDVALQLELGNATATCAEFLDTCDLELGILVCPRTCGYCGPFEYRHTSRYPLAQLTMLPALVYQTRFAAADCHGFASVYQAQPVNPALWQAPALDGERKGPLLHCLDRGRPKQEEFAMERECPPTAPQTGLHACPAGTTMKVTPKADFHGLTVYPKLLAEPSHYIAQLRALQWLDVQTDTVSISTMAYTEEIEVFTSLTVDFQITRSGRVVPSYNLVSYRDLIGGSRATFVISMIVASVAALLGVLLSAHNFYVDRAQCKFGLVMYELVSRTMLLVYPVALLISWSQQPMMSYEFDLLLSAFLSIDGASKDSWRRMMYRFFEVKTHIYEETSWLKSQRVAAYLVLYFQFLQLLFYLSAHPKMGVLTSTVHKAAAQLVHFTMLFSVIYLLLGFVAHWMFGEHIVAFSSMGHTLQAQSQMLLGEDLIPDGVDELSAGYLAMYWLYAATFMIVIFFTLLNFFLAIIVDAFCEVKDNVGKDAILGDFFSDLWRVIRINAKWSRRGWPARNKFTRYWTRAVAQAMQKSWLDELTAEDKDEEHNDGSSKVLVTAEQVIEGVEGLTEDHLAEILAFYFSLSSKILNKKMPQSAPASPCKEQTASAAASPSNDVFERPCDNTSVESDDPLYAEWDVDKLPAGSPAALDSHQPAEEQAAARRSNKITPRTSSSPEPPQLKDAEANKVHCSASRASTAEYQELGQSGCHVAAAASASSTQELDVPRAAGPGAAPSGAGRSGRSGREWLCRGQPTI